MNKTKDLLKELKINWVPFQLNILIICRDIEGNVNINTYNKT